MSECDNGPCMICDEAIKEERDEQVRCMQQDMVLSGVKGLPLFSARKRLAEALVARGWRKADMSDTAREVAEKLQPERRRAGSSRRVVEA